MSDAERVAAIERDAELRLLAQLLKERRRPIPPPPTREVYDETLRNDLIALMTFIAEAIHTNYPKQSNRQHATVVALRSRKAS